MKCKPLPEVLPRGYRTIRPHQGRRWDGLVTLTFSVGKKNSETALPLKTPHTFDGLTERLFAIERYIIQLNQVN